MKINLTIKLIPPKDEKWTPKKYDAEFIRYVGIQSQLNFIMRLNNVIVRERNNNHAERSCSFCIDFLNVGDEVCAAFQIGQRLSLEDLNFEISYSNALGDGLNLVNKYRKKYA